MPRLEATPSPAGGGPARLQAAGRAVLRNLPWGDAEAMSEAWLGQYPIVAHAVRGRRKNRTQLLISHWFYFV
jgi:hypothetical protein